MKNLNKTRINIYIMFIIASSILLSCSSTGMQRSEKATTTMQIVENDINAVVVQLDATGSSLEELTKSSQVDVKKAYDLYSDNVSKLEKLHKQIIHHADEMNSRGNDYFEEWQKEGDKYKNAHIQELSDMRRNELSGIYNKIAENSVGVRDAGKAYISDLKEIETYLSNDLTSNGIKALSPISQKAVRDGDKVKYTIKNVQVAIDKARLEMSQSGKN